MKIFRKQLRRWRKNKTQKEAAFTLGVPLPTYINWEQGVNEPPTFARAKIIEIISPTAKSGRDSES